MVKKTKNQLQNETTLNDKQIKFCNEYLIDLNATQAAIRAGYSEKTARFIASENLTKPNIQKYISELQEGIKKRNKISQDEIVQDLIEIKNRCMQNVPVMYYDKIDKEWKQEGDDAGEPLYKFDAIGATKALDLLGKITGAYQEDNKQKQQTITNNINGFQSAEAFAEHFKKMIGE